jgi:DNA-binding IscR family transcriptional regulator
MWADVGEHMRRYLDSYTLADCVEQAGNFRPGSLPESAPEPA